MSTVRTTFWAVVEPRWSPWYNNTLHSVSIRRVTQRKPREETMDVGTVLVKLTVELPREAFIAPVFEGEIAIGPGEYEQVTATVTAEPLDDGDG